MCDDASAICKFKELSQNVSSTALQGTRKLKAINNVSTHGGAIDCIRTLQGNRLATKSSDGWLCIWEQSSMDRLVVIKIPGCAVGSEPSLFGSTSCGDFVVVGNATGDVYVYDTVLGTMVCQKKTGRIKHTSLCAVGISDDCKHVLCTYGSGYIWRYEYISPMTISDQANRQAGLL
eukprot:CAMPEP_0114229422 /NCGR_PEP_ID=MMETSP0058-20121206/2896_1 /TAXON_ID=36894 /ORGANISM="Pyramimonas parkeae, CCMP726" /LENGTH=175 /DNA_ID=CAMNT_0001340491 /DNA_START=1423 /DNA_END=1950 /DNA_ORIENTATION=+